MSVFSISNGAGSLIRIVGLGRAEIYEHRAIIAPSEGAARYHEAEGSGSECGFRFLAAGLHWSMVAGMVARGCHFAFIGADSSAGRYGVPLAIRAAPGGEVQRPFSRTTGYPWNMNNPWPNQSWQPTPGLRLTVFPSPLARSGCTLR